MSPWKYFSDEEAKGINPRHMDYLDAARDAAGVRFTITSGYRDPAANEAVGGVVDSAHTKGLATDLRIETPAHLHAILRGLFEAGFKRFVLGLRLEGGKLVFHNLHVDSDLTKPYPVFSVKLYK